MDLGIQNTALSLSVSNQETRAESTPIPNDDGNMNEHGRSTSQTLVYGSVGYHMVNWLVIFVIREILLVLLCFASLM